MDLVAVAGTDTVVVYRVVSWEKLYVLEMKASALSWRPDGKYLCVAEQGVTRLIWIESGEEIDIPQRLFYLPSMEEDQARAVHMWWTTYDTSATECDQADQSRGANEWMSHIQYQDSSAWVLPDPDSQCDPDATECEPTGSMMHYMKTNIPASKGTVDILYEALSSGMIVFKAFGLVPVGVLNIQQVIESTDEGRNLQFRNFIHVSQNPENSKLLCLVEVRDRAGSEKPFHRLFLIDTTTFFQYASEIQFFSTLVVDVCCLLGVLRKGCHKIVETWDTINTVFRTALTPFQEALSNNASELSLREELCIALAFGCATESAMEVFQSGPNYAQTVRKALQQLEKEYTKVHGVFLKVIIKAVDQLIAKIAVLSALPKAGERFSIFSHTLKHFEELAQVSGKLLEHLLEAQLEMSTTYGQYSALLRWFISLTRSCDLQSVEQKGDAFYETVQVHLSDQSTLPDYDLLHSWLMKPSGEEKTRNDSESCSGSLVREGFLQCFQTLALTSGEVEAGLNEAKDPTVQSLWLRVCQEACSQMSNLLTPTHSTLMLSLDDPRIDRSPTRLARCLGAFMRTQDTGYVLLPSTAPSELLLLKLDAKKTEAVGHLFAYDCAGDIKAAALYVKEAELLMIVVTCDAESRAALSCFAHRDEASRSEFHFEGSLYDKDFPPHPAHMTIDMAHSSVRRRIFDSCPSVSVLEPCASRGVAVILFDQTVISVVDMEVSASL